MPVHDWTRVPSGLFHDFHQTWSIHIKAVLNGGLLPQGLSALVEQRVGLREGDVLTVEHRHGGVNPQSRNGSTLLTAERPLAQIVRRSSRQVFAGRANRIVVRHHLGRIVAVIEIVSPGNKDSRSAVRDFVEKAVQLVRSGVHLLIIDLFPPTPRDPASLHKLIWDEIEEEPFQLPPGKDRTLISYESGRETAAYIQPITVGERMPDMPLFLIEGGHILVPLEQTYQTAWESSAAELRRAVETGVLPREED